MHLTLTIIFPTERACTTKISVSKFYFSSCFLFSRGRNNEDYSMLILLIAPSISVSYQANLKPSKLVKVLSSVSKP